MIRTISLTKRFSGLLALDNVTHRFPDGGVVSVIGPNGAGKSTLVNVITGFTRVDHGSCFIAGLDVGDMKPWQIAQAGVSRTFQQVRLAEGLTMMENLDLARRAGGESLWRAIMGRRALLSGSSGEESFAALGLPNGKLVGELSYGQKKLVSLACCLESCARVLVLDEPIAGVHATYVDKVGSVIRQYGLSALVILVEHDLDFVRDVSDEVIVMHSGRIVRYGSVAEVLDDTAGMVDVFTR